MFYEKRGDDLFRLWVCECNNVSREDNLTDLGLAMGKDVGIIDES